MQGIIFKGLGMPLSGGDGPDQATIAGQGDCASLAGQHYENLYLSPLAISPLADSQIIQKASYSPSWAKGDYAESYGERKSKRSSR